MRERVPGVGLEEWRAVSQCSGGTPSHHCSLVMFGNLEVSLSYFLCFLFAL